MAGALHGDDARGARIAFDYALAWLDAAPPDPPLRAHEVRALAQPLFAQWRGRFFDRDVMRVLAPERYYAWLREKTAPLHDGDWPGTLRGFLEWLGNLHLLGREVRGRACERAAAALPGLHDEQVSADHELGIGGAARFSDDEMRAAQKARNRQHCAR